MMNTKRREAFTIVELLTGIAVLVIMVTLLSQVFTQAQKSFERGSTTVLRNSSARIALEIVATELELAVVDSKLAMKKFQDVNLPLGGTSTPLDFDSIYFTTMGGTQEDDRSYQQVYYKVSPRTNDQGTVTFALVRRERDFAEARENNVDALGAEKEWWDHGLQAGWAPAQVVAENVVSFDVYLYSGDPNNFGDNPTSPKPGFGDNNFVSSDAATVRFPFDRDKMLPYLDVFLQVTSDDAMKRATLLFEGGQASRAIELMDKESNRFVTRVYPRMRLAEVAQPTPY